MIRVLVFVEARGGQVQSITNELIHAANQITGGALEVVACVCSEDSAPIVSALQGVHKILHMSHAAFRNYTPDSQAIAVRVAIEHCKPDVVLIGYTTSGLDLATYVSATFQWPLAGYCTAVSVQEGELHSTSQLYRGKLMVDAVHTLPAVALVVPGSFDDTTSGAEPKELVALDAPASVGHGLIRHISSAAPDAGDFDLTRAERIVCVGRGLGNQDKLPLAREVAELLGAEIAGSRPVIDAGWLPKSRQVGKSGQKVQPKLYIALGISGAPEHLEGMRKSNFIIAVNPDSKAPIFDVADVGTTCDMFELMPALVDVLKN